MKKQGVTSGFQTEIILLTILAASIILIISNLGMGGVVGAAISKASFGIMGLLAYVFPVLIFVGAAFLVSNSKNPLAYKKALAALVFFVFLCGLVQLLTEGYMSSTTMSEYYSTCSTYRTGGLVGWSNCDYLTDVYQNCRVGGSIESGSYSTAGLIGDCWSTVRVEDCAVYATKVAAF